MPGNALGDRGETLAAEFLERAGWDILRRNYRVGRKEVDLVARRGVVIAFVEVKTRSATLCGHPLEAITPRKQRDIGEVASVWIQQHGSEQDVYRFDAISVTALRGGPALVEHVEDAWGL